LDFLSVNPNVNGKEDPSLMDEKVIDLINTKADFKWISLEFFPPRTEQGLNSLYSLAEKLKDICSRKFPHNPLFTNITWGAGGSTGKAGSQFHARK